MSTVGSFMHGFCVETVCVQESWLPEEVHRSELTSETHEVLPTGSEESKCGYVHGVSDYILVDVPTSSCWGRIPAMRLLLFPFVVLVSTYHLVHSCC